MHDCGSKQDALHDLHLWQRQFVLLLYTMCSVIAQWVGSTYLYLLSYLLVLVQQCLYKCAYLAPHINAVRLHAMQLLLERTARAMI